MTMIAHRPSSLRAYAAHRVADVLDAVALGLFAIAAMIVAASVPFYWLSGIVDAVSAAVRPQRRG